MSLLDDAIREHLDLKRKRGADPGEIERLEREALGPVRREPVSQRVEAGLQFEVDHEDDRILDSELPAEPELHDFEVDEPATELHQLPAEPPVPQPKRGFLRRNRSVPPAQLAPTDFTKHLDDDPFSPEVTEHPSDASPQPFVDSKPPQRPRFIPDPSVRPGPSTTPGHNPVDEPHVGEPELSGHRPEPQAAMPPPVPATPPPAAPPALPEADEADEPGVTREWNVDDALTGEEATDAAPTAPAEEDVLEETPEFLQDTPDHDRLWFEQRPPRDFDFDG